LANAALLSEISVGGCLSTPARNYAACVVRRSERANVKSMIIEEQHEKLKAAVTKRKAFQSGKRAIVDGKHILTTPEIHDRLVEWEKSVKKRKITGVKKGKQRRSEVEEEYTGESRSMGDEDLAMLDCIEVLY